MVIEEFATLPERPASVAEWEELLVRLEIVPRVVRNSVDELENRAAAAQSLEKATRREAEVGRWLEEAARMEPREAGNPPEGFSSDPADLALRFASLRARTFAMVQRRGLEVWEWQAPLTGGGAATVHQLLLWLAGRDGVLLSDLREAALPRRA